MSEIKKPTNNENIIFYNNDLEQLLAQSAEECESLGILHLASYEKYNRLSNIINIPVIILSSGIGFITGIDLNYDKMNIILGIGSVFVGIIKSVDSYFQLGKRAESHRMCALQYTQINKKIQIELSLCREQRQTAKDMLSIIKTDIKNLQDISPVIDQEIIKEYNIKYGKYKNVKKPNFVNGLSSVKVNANSLEQELAAGRSIPQSIHSGAPSRAMSVIGDNNYYGGGGSGGGGNNGFNNNGNNGFNNGFNNNGLNNNGNNGFNNNGFNNNGNNGFNNNGNNEFNNNGNNGLNDGFIVNLNDVAVNIPALDSKPNSRIISPLQTPSQTRPKPSVSASAQLVFVNSNANSSIETPVSSSPISTLRLEHGQVDNTIVTSVASSRLSTPQLLTSFQHQPQQPEQQQPEQPQYNEVANNENNKNGEHISFVMDIPIDPELSPGSQIGSM